MRKGEIKWTLSACKAVASRYKTRVEWQDGCGSSYVRAGVYGFRDECCQHMTQKRKPNWTFERCQADALKYVSRQDWRNKSSGGHSAALKKGWMDEVSSHMNVTRRKWTTLDLIESASNYKTVGQWREEKPGAYAMATKKGVLSECTSHMVFCGGSDSNAVYIWRAKGEFYNGNPVYKIGITSIRLGDSRISSCARSMGFDYELLILANVGEEARHIEALIHTLGCLPQYAGGDGYTEFRALTGSELFEAIDLIKNAMEVGK